MNSYSRKILNSSAIALAILAANGSAFAGTLSQDITNAKQESQIWTTYALSPYLRASDLKVTVDNGKATISGKVEEDVDRDLAKQIALGVNGIKDVDNLIVVEPDYVPVKKSSERSYGEIIDDASITAAIKSKLLWSKHTDGLDVNVDTSAGAVKLIGVADTAESKELAGRLAMNTRGVVSVDNQLLINEAPKTTSIKSKSTNNQISDSWITTKVKSTFIYSSNVDSSDISVKTEKGVVTLTGKLSSGAERALAIEFANNVRGVKSVNAENLTI